MMQYPMCSHKKQSNDKLDSSTHLRLNKQNKQQQTNLTNNKKAKLTNNNNKQIKKTNKKKSSNNNNKKQIYVTVPHDPVQLLSRLPLWMLPAITRRGTSDTTEEDMNKLHTVVAATLLGCVIPTK